MPASLVCGALAELLAGALEEAGPLAELEVVGEVVGGSLVGGSDVGGSLVGGSDVGGRLVGGLVVGGFVVEDGGFVVGFVGELDEPPPEPCVPLGSSDGFADSVGVGSSDVPRVPSGPGSVGRLVAVPVSPEPWPFSAFSAPRPSSPAP